MNRSIDAIVDDLAFSMNVDVSEKAVLDILHLVQELDPAGVGARNLQECLLIQIKRKQDGDISRYTAKKILENHFEEFLLEQPQKVQDKIFKIIEAIETLERVPANYLKSMEGTNGLYEARIQLGSNIWRVFCFFDDGKLVILLNGFQKKTQKTPKNEMEKALKLMTKYYTEKKSK